MLCRHCKNESLAKLVDLGAAPPSNAYLSYDHVYQPELFIPLRVFVCDSCWLVQTEDFIEEEDLFQSDYAYFSSYSETWINHAREYAERMVSEMQLGCEAKVCEVASNDGYLLQFFDQKGIQCIGVEPTAATATAARQKGLTVIQDFFGTDLADSMRNECGQIDLMAANKVLAHVPDINDFVEGFARLLTDDGVATFEFPHLVNLIKGFQPDTIYHEHYSYLSFIAATNIKRNGLSAFNVENTDTRRQSPCFCSEIRKRTAPCKC